MSISVIIPTLNEEANIGRLARHLLHYGNDTLNEIIIVDGGSTDNTVTIAKKTGVKVIESTCGRAIQMNTGKQFATGNILYFVHCDTLPPKTYLVDIQIAIQNNFPIGCFRSIFDSDRPLLRINGFFSRFDQIWCRGGDQTLFVTRQLFEELNGYKEDLILMEEYDFMIRARKKYSFKIIPNKVLVSARKYEKRSFFKVQFANLVVFNMFRFGASQKRLVETYKRLLG